MRIKVAKYISQFLVDHGVAHTFTVTGGGAMHLNDAFGHQEGMQCIYNHHEQACAIAAEGYARYSGKVAAVCVTSGPGGTNAITGVLGGWQDSIPMFVVSGQVKRETTTECTGSNVRQLGDQEFQIVDSVRNMTKYAVMVKNPEDIRYIMEKAWYLCNHGRKGPVWIDVPVDVQGSYIECNDLVGLGGSADGNLLKSFYGTEEAASMIKAEVPVYDETQTAIIVDKIRAAKRPVIFAGTGIRLAGAHKEFVECVEALQIPVVTAWNAHDVLPDNHPLYVGRPGTVGLRGGNFVVQGADLLLVLGSRLNIRLISYNYENFAKNAEKIVVDIDEKELNKPTVKVDMKVHADVRDVMASIAEYIINKKENAGSVCGNHDEWVSLAKSIHERYPAVRDAYYDSKMLNPYVFISKLTHLIPEDEAIICGNGSACVITFQAAKIKNNQRLFTNSGCAAMGYGFPAAVGVAINRGDKRTICVDGDGSFQMNMQELQTVAYHNQNLKIVIINNNGYHSIRQTQTNLFKGQPYVGISSDNGISFPDMEKIAYAYGIAYSRIESVADCGSKLEQALNVDGPIIIEAVVDPNQNFEPKLSSKALPDGTMVSPEPDDMYPFLSEDEYKQIKQLMM
ncbi:MAG: thiamine pyrophosphate-binding protein [Lachnospiraceae bacterium]|nr:thiamine pyrophosphate-binding protein [Candidatus Merdinaster equi]